MVAESGADAVGLNFFPKSPRYVQPETARRISAAIARRVVKVGVFVNASRREVCQLFDQLRLDLIQLHGDEPPEFLAALGGRPVMRAFRVGSAGLGPTAEYLDHCRRLNCLPRMILVDAWRAGQYGGTGKRANWSALREYAVRLGSPPLVLAGGLTPANVARAIRTVRPHAVDAASSLETSPGRKNGILVRQFVLAARQALRGIGLDSD